MWFADGALKALQGCHMLGYHHRDIKYDNIAVRVDDHALRDSKVILLDFALAMTGDERGVGTRFMRYEDWFPPARSELVDRGKRDRFAIGLTCVELVFHYWLHRNHSREEARRTWLEWRQFAYRRLTKTRREKLSLFGKRFLQIRPRNGADWLRWFRDHTAEDCYDGCKYHEEYCTLIAAAMRGAGESCWYDIGERLNLAWERPVQPKRKRPRT